MAFYATLGIGKPKTKSNMKQQRHSLVSMRRLALIAAALTLLAGGAGVAQVHADSVADMQAQIDSLNSQNDANQQTVSSLTSQAASYQQQIDRLNSQIASLQAQIDSNRTKQAKLGAEIQEKQRELDQQRQALGEDLKAMYVSGQMSTVEMLATSKSLSDFVNAATYSTAVQNKIQSTLDTIAQLQNQLRAQKTQVEELLAALSQQQTDLSGKQAEQQHLLAMNQSQQDAYNAQIRQNQSKISSLRQKIIEANLPSGGSVYYGSACDSSHGDTYPTPLCNSAQDSIVDQWGLYNRECVSYVAWKEYSDGKYVPYGLGNAGDWPSHVPGSWIDNSPRAGDAAVRPTIPGLVFSNGEGDVGHVMYVEHVNSDGTIAISQYNASLDGTYSYVPNRSASGLVFIHFPSR